LRGLDLSAMRGHPARVAAYFSLSGVMRHLRRLILVRAHVFIAPTLVRRLLATMSSPCLGDTARILERSSQRCGSIGERGRPHWYAHSFRWRHTYPALERSGQGLQGLRLPHLLPRLCRSHVHRGLGSYWHPWAGQMIGIALTSRPLATCCRSGCVCFFAARPAVAACTLSSNPSIERTSSSVLRTLLVAAHVKRWASHEAPGPLARALQEL
jgi:hypothetical protein